MPAPPPLPPLAIIIFQIPHPWEQMSGYRISNRLCFFSPATLKPTAPMSKWDAIILLSWSPKKESRCLVIFLYLSFNPSSNKTCWKQEYWGLQTTLLPKLRWYWMILSQQLDRVCPLGLSHNFVLQDFREWGSKTDCLSRGFRLRYLSQNFLSLRSLKMEFLAFGGQVSLL